MSSVFPGTVMRSPEGPATWIPFWSLARYQLMRMLSRKYPAAPRAMRYNGFGAAWVCHVRKRLQGRQDGRITHRLLFLSAGRRLGASGHRRSVLGHLGARSPWWTGTEGGM